MSYTKTTKRKNLTKRIILSAIVFLIVNSIAAVVSTVVIYNSFFERYERPDYSLYPGMYCYERFEDSLPRTTLTVTSGENGLAAYYYPTSSPKGLAVIVHGRHAGADDYLPLIEAMVNGGYAVFAYDGTGVYSSGGEDSIGMCQQLVDLDAILSYLEVTLPYADMPKLLIGHSLGGYAAASVLALHSDVRACVCIAPMCDGSTVMIEKSEEYVGALAYTAKPIFDAYQSYLFGEYTKYNSVVGINSTDIPILIAQGLNDTVITHDGQSITAHLDEITNPNVSVYHGEGLQGTHTGIWHSTQAEEYVIEVNAKSSGLTPEEKRQFYKTVDHRLYSEVNEELIELIFATFEKAVR